MERFLADRMILMDTDDKGDRAKATSTRIIHNQTTGKYAGKVTIQYESGHDVPIDELPPPGVEAGTLSKTKPVTDKGSTQAAHISEALEKNESD